MSSRSLITGLVLLLAVTGCQWTQRFAQRDPFSPKATCALPPEVSKTDLINHLNRNILPDEGKTPLRGWKSESTKVYVSAMPVGANAIIHVEAPRNLRIRVSNPLTNTAMLDIGSNQEQFWIWSKDAPEKVVLTCKHDDIAATATNMQLPLPIHPDWLMEVLGVVPLDPAEFRLERPSNGSQFTRLISERHGPTGEPVERIIEVNACHGIIDRHILRRVDGEVIATASMLNYFRHPETGMTFAKQIRIDLPEDSTGKKMYLVLQMEKLQINPSTDEDSIVFEVPQLNGHRIVDLGEAARSMQNQVQPLSPTEHNPFAGTPRQVADASEGMASQTEEMTSPTASGIASGTAPREGELEAPEWPPHRAARTGMPTLGFEEEQSASPANYLPPGTNFEPPTAVPDRSARPAFENAIRGQSPTASTTSPANEQGPHENTSQPSTAARFMGGIRSLFRLPEPTANGQPSVCSPATSRSSWGRPRLGQE